MPSRPEDSGGTRNASTQANAQRAIRTPFKKAIISYGKSKDETCDGYGKHVQGRKWSHLIDRRVVNDRVQYLVAWSPTWEDETNLVGAGSTIEALHASLDEDARAAENAVTSARTRYPAARKRLVIEKIPSARARAYTSISEAATLSDGYLVSESDYADDEKKYHGEAQDSSDSEDYVRGDLAHLSS